MISVELASQQIRVTTIYLPDKDSISGGGFARSTLERENDPR